MRCIGKNLRVDNSISQKKGGKEKIGRRQAKDPYKRKGSGAIARKSIGREPQLSSGRKMQGVRRCGLLPKTQGRLHINSPEGGGRFFWIPEGQENPLVALRDLWVKKNGTWGEKITTKKLSSSSAQ